MDLADRILESIDLEREALDPVRNDELAVQRRRWRWTSEARARLLDLQARWRPGRRCWAGKLAMRLWWARESLRCR